MLEVRTPEMRRQRPASMLATEGGDPGRVAGLLAACREEGERALVVEKLIGRPADPCPGPCAQPEVGVLHRYHVIVVATERLEQFPGEEARPLQGPHVHGALERADFRPVALAETAFRNNH